MHDLNLRLFYKAYFDVRSIKEDGDVLWSTIWSLRSWMVGKWQRRGIEIPDDDATWSAFKRGAEFKSLDGDGLVQFSSRAFYDGDSTVWACRIVESERHEGLAPRQWTTEVGFSDDGHGAGAFSVVLSWGDEPGSLLPCAPEPMSTVPGIIRKMMDNRELRCFVDGEPLRLEPKTVKRAGIAPFRDLVLDARRSTPLVVIAADDDGSFALDPGEVARTLGPSAPVYACGDADVLGDLNRELGDWHWRVEAGWVRVYLGRPKPKDPADHLRHCYWTADRIEAMGADVLLGVLRRALAADVNFYETMTRIPDVARMIGRCTSRKKTNALLKERDTIKAEKDKAVEDALELAQSVDDELDLALDELEHVKQRIKELQAENYALANKVEWLTPFAEAARRSECQSQGLGAWPLSPSQVADVFLAAYPDRIDFTERAKRTLEDCPTNADVLWNALRDLVEIAHPIYADEAGTDISRVFNDRSTFEYARGAGMMTRHNSELMASYRDTYQGRELNVQPHLKNGVKESDPKFLRMYFSYDEPSGKIVVSHVGRHLETYGSRRMK